MGRPDRGEHARGSDGPRLRDRKRRRSLRLDIAKAIALGARAGGLAKPFLGPAGKGVDEVVALIETLTLELRTAMFVTGSASLSELRDTDYVVLGRTNEYIEQRRR